MTSFHHFNQSSPDVQMGRYQVTRETDLVPAELKTKLDPIASGVLEDIATYFFTAMFFAALAKVERQLNTQRYLVGAGITEADIRLFHVLIRFDVNQHPSNKRSLDDFPNFFNYLRDLYQMPAFKTTVHWNQITMYLKNCNPDGRDPMGPAVDYEAAHDRECF